MRPPGALRSWQHQWLHCRHPGRARGDRALWSPTARFSGMQVVAGSQVGLAQEIRCQPDSRQVFARDRQLDPAMAPMATKTASYSCNNASTSSTRWFSFSSTPEAMIWSISRWITSGVSDRLAHPRASCHLAQARPRTQSRRIPAGPNPGRRSTPQGLSPQQLPAVRIIAARPGCLTESY